MTAGLGEPRLPRAGAIAAWGAEKAGRCADVGVNVAGARPVPSRPVDDGVRKCIHVLTYRCTTPRLGETCDVAVPLHSSCMQC